jgi:hypothetical protein
VKYAPDTNIFIDAFYDTDAETALPAFLSELFPSPS